MTQQSSSLAALPVVLSSIPSDHMVAHNHLYWGSDTLFWTKVVHANRALIHKINTSFKKKRASFYNSHLKVLPLRDPCPHNVGDMIGKCSTLNHISSLLGVKIRIIKLAVQESLKLVINKHVKEKGAEKSQLLRCQSVNNVPRMKVIFTQEPIGCYKSSLLFPTESLMKCIFQQQQQLSGNKYTLFYSTSCFPRLLA